MKRFILLMFGLCVFVTGCEGELTNKTSAPDLNVSGLLFAKQIGGDINRCANGNGSCITEGGNGFCKACNQAGGWLSWSPGLDNPTNNCWCGDKDFNPYFSNCVNGVVIGAGDVGRTCPPTFVWPD
jgi:hypothetical protein